MIAGEAIGFDNNLAGMTGCTTINESYGKDETASLIDNLLSAIPWTSYCGADTWVSPTA